MIRFIHCCKQNSIQLRRIPALSFSKYPTIYSRDNKDKLQHSFVGNTVLKQITTNHSCRNYSNKNEGNSEPDEPSGVRQFPRFSDKLIKPPRVFFLPLIYWFVTNSMEALKIRNQYDPDFNKNDFIEGSKRALEVNTIFVGRANARLWKDSQKVFRIGFFFARWYSQNLHMVDTKNWTEWLKMTCCTN